MIDQFLHYFIYESTWAEQYILVFFHFFLIYFGLAPVFAAACRFLEEKGLLNKIEASTPSKKQINREKKYSFVSILIFGISGTPLIYGIREGYISTIPDTLPNILWSILLLTIWNEFHFFVIHRIMHIPFFMKRVHKIHHASVVPSVYSAYSLHWFEAFLLSTVAFTLAIWVPLSPLSIFLFSLVSILLNFSGHCNYRFGKGKGASWKLLGTRHNQHHTKSGSHFGFAMDTFDRLYKLFIDKK